MISTLRLASKDITVEGLLEALRSYQTRGVDLLITETAPSISAIKQKRRNPKKNKWCDNHKNCGHTTAKCKGIGLNKP
ncbi:hypothetical protein ENBRE01_2670 [Enteropsectra breve]|nr:hypothetical protein ENBRE01_2670 [Enteropsectra breve]